MKIERSINHPGISVEGEKTYQYLGFIFQGTVLGQENLSKSTGVNYTLLDGLDYKIFKGIMNEQIRGLYCGFIPYP